LIEAAKGANALTPKMAVPKGMTLGSTPKKSEPCSLEEEIKMGEGEESSKHP
jgi:hypothetical protein